MRDYLYVALVWDTTVPMNEAKAIAVATVVKAQDKKDALNIGWQTVDTKYYVVNQEAELLGDVRGSFVITHED